MTAQIETLSSRKNGGPAIDLFPIVEALRESREVSYNIRHQGKVRELPSPKAIRESLDGLLTALFPTHLGPHGLKYDSVDLFVANTLATTLTRLGDQVSRSLLFSREELSPEEAQRATDAIIRGFAGELPAIRATLVGDLKAAQRQDPESESLGEVLLCDEGFAALYRHRVADALHRQGARLVARIISRQGA
jgi:serine O-acetyltransferase